MQLHIYKDVDEVTTALAEWITELIVKTLSAKEKFTIALSGGETPKTLYKKLASSPYSEKIDWNKIYFFWGDERVVPFKDERNNAKMAYDNLLDKVNAVEDHIHIMQTGIEPVQSAIEYEKILHQYFDDKPTTFDLVLLGMGDDGHTLSLFPNSLILFQNNKWVNIVDAPAKKMKRITLMPGVVNKSASVAFLVTGEGKAKILQQVLEEQEQKINYPVQLIKPISGELHWFVDEPAFMLCKRP
jgi:6-phosphogluconolactonase